MDKEMKKENNNQKSEDMTEKFIEVYNQLNTENKRKVDEMIIKEYIEQVSEGKD